jgi:hypothetical protein
MILYNKGPESVREEIIEYEKFDNISVKLEFSN